MSCIFKYIVSFGKRFFVYTLFSFMFMRCRDAIKLFLASLQYRSCSYPKTKYDYPQPSRCKKFFRLSTEFCRLMSTKGVLSTIEVKLIGVIDVFENNLILFSLRRINNYTHLEKCSSLSFSLCAGKRDWIEEERRKTDFFTNLIFFNSGTVTSLLEHNLGSIFCFMFKTEK